MTPRRPAAHRRALAMVEVAISIAILGGLMAAVMNAVGKAAVQRSRTVERIQGYGLAESLMAEILSQRYDDPTPPAAGVNLSLNILGVTVSVTSPSGNPSRAAFDALDDYDGWRASPPLARDGSVIAGYTGWEQQVEVELVSAAAPGGAVAGANAGLKRVTVVLVRNKREIARVVSLRTRAWEQALDAR